MTNFNYTPTGIKIILDYLKNEKLVIKHTIKGLKELYKLKHIEKKTLKKHTKYLKTIDKYLDLTINIMSKYKNSLLQKESLEHGDSTEA